jgi:Heavy metal associated domain 2
LKQRDSITSSSVLPSPMSIEHIRLVHAIPGRVRFKIDDLKGNPDRAEQLQHRLSSIPGIEEAHVNPQTGSVIAFFDPAALESIEFQLAVASALGISLADVGSDLLTSWTTQYRNGSTDDSDRPWALDDLKTLVPLVLLLLGIRSLLVTDKLLVPSWYDYFWFSFGSYAILSRDLPPRV